MRGDLERGRRSCLLRAALGRYGRRRSDVRDGTVWSVRWPIIVEWVVALGDQARDDRSAPHPVFWPPEVSIRTMSDQNDEVLSPIAAFPGSALVLAIHGIRDVFQIAGGRMFRHLMTQGTQCYPDLPLGVDAPIVENLLPSLGGFDVEEVPQDHRDPHPFAFGEPSVARRKPKAKGCGAAGPAAAAPRSAPAPCSNCSAARRRSTSSRSASASRPRPSRRGARTLSSRSSGPCAKALPSRPNSSN